MIACTRVHPGTKAWDRVLLRLLLPALLSVFPVAAIDAARMQGSRVPDGLGAPDYLLLTAGMSIRAWAACGRGFLQ